MKYFIYSIVMSNTIEHEKVLFASENFTKVNQQKSEICKQLGIKEDCLKIDVTTKPIRSGSKLEKYI